MTAAVVVALLIMLGLIAADVVLVLRHHRPRHCLHHPAAGRDRLRHLIARRPR